MLPASVPERKEQADRERSEETAWRRPGWLARHDYEYDRNGTANLFIVCEPLAGWWRISVTDRRTKVDWAHYIKELADIHYPHAEKIVLMMGNLNTYTLAALYEAL